MPAISAPPAWRDWNTGSWCRTEILHEQRLTHAAVILSAAKNLPRFPATSFAGAQDDCAEDDTMYDRRAKSLEQATMNRTRFSIVMALAGGLAVTAAAGQTAAFSGQKSQWNGYDRYDFAVDGRPCLVVVQKRPPGKPWIWRTEFFGHEPQADLSLLAKGFHAVYMDVQNMYGPRGRAAHGCLLRRADPSLRAGEKAVLEGFSRGGLFAYNWAAAHPDRVACIYGDAPVCDFKSWPGGKGKGPGSPGDWQNVLSVYGLTEAEAMAYRLNPVDNLAPLAKAGVPLLHVVGDADDAVPLAEIRRRPTRYKQLGGQIAVIVKKGVGHHPHSLKDPAPIADFILKHDAVILCVIAGS